MQESENWHLNQVILSITMANGVGEVTSYRVVYNG